MGAEPGMAAARPAGYHTFMQHRSPFWMILGALTGLIAVAASALGAHLHSDAATQRSIASAAQMNGWHALALLFCAVWPGGRWIHAAGLCFTVGMLLFCGSLYATALGRQWLFVAPYGGGLLMLGWVLLAAAALVRGR